MRTPVLPSVSRRRRRPRYADVAATLALAVAVSGTAYAVTELPANSVGTTQLKRESVTLTKMGLNSVGTTTIRPYSVQGEDVAGETLTLANLKGAGATGTMNLELPAGKCIAANLDAPHAVRGQAALFSFSGTVGIPVGLMSSPAKVIGANRVGVRFCNVSPDAISVHGIGFRVVTFG